MNKQIIVAVLFVSTCALALPTKADSFLSPVTGYFTALDVSHSYYVSVRDLIGKRALDSSAAMLSLPSFQPERIVYLSRREDRVFVVSVGARESIWFSDNRSEVQIYEREREIGANAAALISEVFEHAVSATRYPTVSESGADGTSYYFSAFIPGIGVRAGHTWSPHPGTVCVKLVILGQRMHGYVGGGVSETNLIDECRQLLEILKKAAQPGATDNPGDAQ